MTLENKKALFTVMMNTLESESPTSWEEIAFVLQQLTDNATEYEIKTKEEFTGIASAGSAFITFDYGIDGVSIEISKYAQSLEALFENTGGGTIHLIGGDFYSQADSVIHPEWKRYKIEGSNGWSKWDGGKWFSALFYEDMPAGSHVSSMLAVEIYRQAVSFARRLGAYLVDHDIRLLVPVNIASNPGNMALTLAVVMVSEALGVHVINSNHDFYWDGGKPTSERAPGEPPGIRDHFFRNMDNRLFFNLFQSLFPWKGLKWLQVNINKLQSRILVEQYSFSEDRVYELSTCVSDEFFEDYTDDDVKLARLRMGHILSDGEKIIKALPVDEHMKGLNEWMRYQTPRMLGARGDLSVDPTSDRLIYLLQPTRIVARKRIERDLHLIKALLTHEPFRETFAQSRLQLVLHITGPTPIEHQADHERILQAYLDVIKSLPTQLAERIFLAFSVGNEDHPSLEEKGFQRMSIDDIYRMANVVVFPSEVEGRGLPIIEASACGVPVICSRYHPQEVFAEVVGEDLPEADQILYTLFPEGAFTEAFLDEVSQLLLYPDMNQSRIQHNKEVVRTRYSMTALTETFEYYLDILNSMK